ncbi:EAL domain-containing protein [Nakamurella panacisegetis]|uniref:EAL domain-containing protein n=1 Tax=Nakamurella panacisegetis TaxID=1090615 RepID=UPI000B83F6BD|nr:EAL domain-containing protein [Nakamurella panacisegetis]
MGQITALGVLVAIDDFGTGYSSLLKLKRYPSSRKGDRQLAAGLGLHAGLHASDDAIVVCVIGLAHAVGAICVAEGVETQEQYSALRVMGCDQAQGLLFGRAVPVRDPPGAIAQCLLVCATTNGVRADT